MTIFLYQEQERVESMMHFQIPEWVLEATNPILTDMEALNKNNHLHPNAELKYMLGSVI